MHADMNGESCITMSGGTACAAHGTTRAMCANQERYRTAGAPRRDRQREEEEGGWSSALASARMFHSKAMRRTSLQQHIAAHSSKLLQDPESNLPSLRALLELTLEEDSVVRFPCMHVAHYAAVSVAERRIFSTQARTHE